MKNVYTRLKNKEVFTEKERLSSGSNVLVCIAVAVISVGATCSSGQVFDAFFRVCLYSSD